MRTRLKPRFTHSRVEARSRSSLGDDPRLKPIKSRWVLTWKWDPIGQRWGIKAMLAVKGFADRQGYLVLTRSPTAARTAQRLLVSTAVLFHRAPISADISTAFLQGDWLSDHADAQGTPREVVVDLSADAWALLPSGVCPSFISDPIAYLLKAVYGLKDAPLLWANHLYRTLQETLGWDQSAFDDSVFFFREQGAHRLLGMITVHVDDLGCCGESKVISILIDGLDTRFGGKKGLKIQRDEYDHVAMHYKVYSDGTVATGQAEYVKTLQKKDVRGRSDEPMDVMGVTDTRSVTGSCQYAANSRPDLMGRIAATASSISTDCEGSPPTWRALSNADQIVDDAQVIADESRSVVSTSR